MMIIIWMYFFVNEAEDQVGRFCGFALRQNLI